MRCVFRRNSGSLTIDGPLSETSRWRAVARVLRSPIDSLGCVLLPAPCALCGSPLPQLSSVPICEGCWAEVKVRTADVAQCAVCGDTLDFPSSFSEIAVPAGSNVGICRACRVAPPPFSRAVSYGPYEDRMRAAIHALKYDGMHGAARGLGALFAEAISDLLIGEPTAMLVVPIPLHRSKQAQRGFNQARSLAKYAIESLKDTHPKWRFTLAPSTLMRHRSTESQAGLTPRQRRQNVRGAFGVSDSEAIAGKRVLIVDDIFTTGATARAASRALARAGAATVQVATVARAHLIHRDRRGGSPPFQGAESGRVPSGHAISGHLSEEILQDASMHSSPNHPSF